MLRAFAERLRQGRRTLPFPPAEDALPEGFPGRPALEPSRCREGCRACAESCPTDAIRTEPQLTMDLGRCLFCRECTRACPSGAIRFTRDYRMAASRREDLVYGARAGRLAEPLPEPRRSLLARSLTIRQVTAGGSAGCEQESAALENIVFDSGRFGIHFAASPRHADALLVTGPISVNMRAALEKTHEAVPVPVIVIAAGASAISGAPYEGTSQVSSGADRILPVDLYVPGHPPHPLTILDGLLRLLGRIRGKAE